MISYERLVFGLICSSQGHFPSDYYEIVDYLESEEASPEEEALILEIIDNVNKISVTR